MNTKPFYAAFIETSVHHAGDERSRTHPGHGYPEHTTTHTEVRKFITEDYLKAWIAQQDAEYSKPKYEIVYCTPVKITTSINIELNKGTV